MKGTIEICNFLEAIYTLTLSFYPFADDFNAPMRLGFVHWLKITKTYVALTQFVTVASCGKQGLRYRRCMQTRDLDSNYYY